MGIDDLPAAEFAFPGPLRDRLVAAILSGAKTTTTGLLADYELAHEPLPRPGERSAVVNSAGDRVAVIEVTDVQVIRLAEVTVRHALDEGEGFESVRQWRAGHETFWHSYGFTVNDDTQVVLERFRLVSGLPRRRRRAS